MKVADKFFSFGDTLRKKKFCILLSLLLIAKAFYLKLFSFVEGKFCVSEHESRNFQSEAELHRK